MMIIQYLPLLYIGKCTVCRCAPLPQHASSVVTNTYNNPVVERVCGYQRTCMYQNTALS